jgi:hypothetical protein
MFKVSTYFIKGQIPGVTKSEIIKLYKRELEGQSVNNISSDDDTINFKNNTFRFVLNRFANKFSSFSEGQIKVVDEKDEFGVYFEAKLANLFTSAGLISAIAILFAIFSNGFDIFSLVVGFVVFIVLIIVGFISTNIFFPVYFTNLRNNIEREVQSEVQ